MASIYKRGGIYYVKFRQDGRWVYRSLKTKDKRQAEVERQALELVLSGDAAPEPVSEVVLDFAQLRTFYVGWSASMRSPQTIESRLRALDRFAGMFPGLSPGRVRHEHIELYRKKYLETGVTKRTVNESVTALSGVWSVAIKHGMLAENPLRKVEPFRESKRHPKWLNASQIEAVLTVAAADGRNAHLFFALGIYAGLRKNEAINARWEWLNFEHLLLHVQSGPGFELKDHEDRTLPLHRKLAAILAEYWPGEGATGYLIAPDKAPSGYRYRFDIRKTFGRIVRAAGAPWCTPHTLRHTFASQLVSAGTDLFKVSTWMGHRSYNTTQIYAHLRPSDPDINRF